MTIAVETPVAGSSSGQPRGGGWPGIKQLFSQYKVLALVIAIAVIWPFFCLEDRGRLPDPAQPLQSAATNVGYRHAACGMVFVIIAGEIDLSVGSLLGLLGGVAAVLDVNYHMPLASIWPSWLAWVC